MCLQSSSNAIKHQNTFDPNCNFKISEGNYSITKGYGEANQHLHGNDLLGLMLDATTKETTIKGGKVHFGMQALMDNCKTFFIAGHETTSTFLTWAMMLLGSHTIWQERVREEVMEVCGHGDHPIDANMLNKLKMVL